MDLLLLCNLPHEICKNSDRQTWMPDWYMAISDLAAGAYQHLTVGEMLANSVSSLSGLASEAMNWPYRESPVQYEDSKLGLYNGEKTLCTWQTRLYKARVTC